MGDIGARMLAKALQINSRLKCIYWDRNNTSPQGFSAIATALERWVSSPLPSSVSTSLLIMVSLTVVPLLLSLSSGMRLALATVIVSLSFLSSLHFFLTVLSVNSLQLLSFAVVLHSPPTLSRSLLRVPTTREQLCAIFMLILNISQPNLAYTFVM